MASLAAFLFAYLLGGVTFVPLVLFALYFSLPTPSERPTSANEIEVLLRGGDHEPSKAEREILEKEGSRSQEYDVAAGYFAVCREYVPGGINGKPPERTTPAGETIATESPSVYQSMYRSIFDRNRPPSLEPQKGGKKARNVFFIVLRHGHLMLYDDSEQLEVRHVISLAHHDVSVYGGGSLIPEGELFIKRNALCLKRRVDSAQLGVNGVVPKPFYLFSDNCSEKEDFYIAMLQSQERNLPGIENPPVPLRFDIPDIVKLVQRLHSSEEHLQTRWINALVGRIFLGLYKTREVTDLIRTKITKKIARVKKPTFLSDITIQKIDMGHGPPHITNPRLRDLNVDGDCCAKADVHYSGEFRIQIATTARLDLGTRFKSREVDLVLAVVLRKLEGHLLVRFKPPPSNRFWFSFETMPKLDMSIEPIVSSRQITYGVVLRAIESRIREVVAESIVLPNWDDIAYYDTSRQMVRGGIWTHSSVPQPSTDPVTAAAEQGNVEEVRIKENEEILEPPPPVPLSTKGKTASMPVLPPSPSSSVTSRKPAKSPLIDDFASPDSKPSASTSALDIRPLSEKPKAMRSPSFASASSPIVSMDTATVDAIKEQVRREPKDAASAMIEISNRSQVTSPSMSPVGSPPKYETLAPERYRSNSSSSSKEEAVDDHKSVPIDEDSSVHERPRSTPSSNDLETSSLKSSQSSITNAKRAASIVSRSFLEKRQPSPSTGTGKKWMWNPLNRNNEFRIDKDKLFNGEREGSPARPMGRGQPIPMASADARSIRSSPVTVPKRKPLPPPLLPPRAPAESRKPPPLPKRPQEDAGFESRDEDQLLVVAAPADSEPTSPAEDQKTEYGPFPLVEPGDDASQHEPESEEHNVSTLVESDEPNSETVLNNELDQEEILQHMSSTPEEQGDSLPGWMSAQEEEARAKSIWNDADNEQL